jgi:hypothetical protein
MMKHDIGNMKEILMNTADNMAAAAVSFTSHGYDAFISAREAFKTAVDEIVKEVQEVEEKQR